MSLRKMALSPSGFSLVELMVVVAIIGMLAAVAVPNFKKYQSRAKASAAPLALAALYTGEQSVVSDQDTYAACVGSLSIDQPAAGYYVTGFSTAVNLGKAKVPGCSAGVAQAIVSAPGAISVNSTGILATDSYVIPINLNQIGPVAVAPAMFVAAGAALNGTNTINSDTFTGVSMGSISNKPGVVDTWTVNQNKVITNTVLGY